MDNDAVLPPSPEDDGGYGPCKRTGQLWEGEQQHDIANRIEGTLRGVSSLTLNLEKLRAQAGMLTLVLDSDKPAALRLAPLGAGSVSVDGGPQTALASDGAGVTLELQSGHHTYEVQPT